MRITFTLSVLVMSLAVFCLSCSKTSQDMVLKPASPSTSEITASVSSNAVYEMAVASQNVSILRQASHFEISSIASDEKGGTLKYRYSPAKGFTGTDEVTLSETKTVSYTGGGCNMGGGSMDARDVTSTTFTKIKFTVK